MILRVRRNFFEITTFPNSGIRAWFYALMLYAREEHKELWAIIVILLTIMSYFDSAVLLDEDRHYMTVFVRLVLPPCFAHRWLVGVCFSNFS